MNEKLFSTNISNTTTASNSWEGPETTLEDMLNCMEKVFKEQYKPIIFIWRGPFYSGIRCFQELLDENLPVLRCSKLVDDNTFYLVDGIGIIAGKNAYSKLIKLDFQLIWSDFPLDRVDQNDIFKGMGLIN